MNEKLKIRKWDRKTRIAMKEIKGKRINRAQHIVMLYPIKEGTGFRPVRLKKLLYVTSMRLSFLLFQ